MTQHEKLLAPYDEWAGTLACPVCHDQLRREAASQAEQSFVCTGCARVYPVVDGIPILIPDRAVPGIPFVGG